MKSFGVLFAFVLFASIFANLVFAELNLPPSPPIPDSQSVNSSGDELPPAPSYPPAQGNVVSIDEGKSSTGQSSFIYWLSFVGAIILAFAIAYLVIFLVKKNRKSEVKVFRTSNRKNSTSPLIED